MGLFNNNNGASVFPRKGPEVVVVVVGRVRLLGGGYRTTLSADNVTLRHVPSFFFSCKHLSKKAAACLTRYFNVPRQIGEACEWPVIVVPSPRLEAVMYGSIRGRVVHTNRGKCLATGVFLFLFFFGCSLLESSNYRVGFSWLGVT